MPMPVRLFGAAMGGYEECQRCGRPVIERDDTKRSDGIGTIVVALTTGQRLTFAIVALVFVVVFVVWPIVRPHPRTRTEVEQITDRRRLMRELRRQR